MSTIRIEIEIDDPDNAVAPDMILEIISDFEEVLGKRNLSLYNSSWEQED